ncbi:bromodomain-containing protein DDB_G0280777 [Drosophila mojavensis]|uniref:bromodomain-containing protein DDB_G0280777 n=1 Tax=Drosophila mojavensis TaxID=7230 RepID=UPI00017CAD99|nr:bromodomain-containing protein DDB_G0280777 [Drosophila mojavensis]
MSYQIKRTPYFRRMFNNSRRNGQLQRLREEYERIQEFNDRTIELKMRQVRLKRLFREIEDINESPSTSAAQQRRLAALVPLTPEAVQAQQRRERLDALERARELGQEISRHNAQLVETGAGYFLRSELRLTAKMRAADQARREAQERRLRAARRISYGNAQSRSNIERITQRQQRRLVTNDTPATTLMVDARQQVAQLPMQPATSQSQLHPDLVKRAMLRQRLQYGNSRSTNNMMRSQLAAAQRVIGCISGTDTVSDDLEQMEIQRHHEEQLQLEQQRRLQRIDPQQLHLQEEHQRQLRQHMYMQELQQQQQQQEQEQQQLEHQEQPEEQQLTNQSLSILELSSSVSGCNQKVNTNNLINNHLMSIKDNDIDDSNKDSTINLTNESSNNINDSSNNNILNSSSNYKEINNMDSELEMHTAMLPPTERESVQLLDQHGDNRINFDDVPTTSQHAQRSVDATTTVAAYQPPLADNGATSNHAARRWHRISLMVPWIKVLHERPSQVATVLPPHNLTIAISTDLSTLHNDDNNNNTNNANAISNTINDNHNNNDINQDQDTSCSNISSALAVADSDNFESICGPSLMQEDLIQIMELDDDGHVPTMHVMHHAFK